MSNKITGFCVSNQDCDYDFEFTRGTLRPNLQKMMICGNFMRLWGYGDFSGFIKHLADRIKIIVGYTGQELELLPNDRPANKAVFVNFYSDKIEIENNPNGSFRVFQGRNKQSWCISSSEDLVRQTMNYNHVDKSLSVLELLSAQRRKFRLQSKDFDELKIIIGAGNTSYQGWVATNLPVLDATNQTHWQELFGDKLIDNILAEHVFEHLYYDDSLKAWKNAFGFLKPGGKMRIAVPDKNNPSKYYRDLVKPNGSGAGADDHKFFWGYVELAGALESIGYKVDILECFDEKGVYHSKTWSVEDGFVERSKRFYKGPFTESKEEFNKMLSSVPSHLRGQFANLNLACTSLIVDAIK